VTWKIDGFVRIFSHRRQNVAGGVLDHHAAVSRPVGIGHVDAGAGDSSEHRYDSAGLEERGDRLPPRHRALAASCAL